MDKKVKRIVSIIICLTLLVGTLVSLVACNKDKEKNVTLSQVYVSTQTYNEFSGADSVAILPVGWSVYVDSSSSEASDVGYIKDMNAFIIKTTDNSGDMVLSVIKLQDENVYYDGGAKGMLFQKEQGIVAMRIQDGLIAVKFKNGNCAVYNSKAKILLSRSKIQDTKSADIDDVIKILGPSMIAVGNQYDPNGYSGYTTIYRTTSSGDISNRGEVVAYVKNSSNDISNILGFDDKYVSVNVTTDSELLFSIPTTANGNPQKLDGGNGKITATSSEDDYYYEVTYFGNGRFFVYIDYTVEESEGYTYYDGTSYYKVSRYIYYADTDEMVPYTKNADKIFMQLSNSFYGSEKIGVDVNLYLNEGYTYALYGLNIFDNNGVKTGFYDQYILDSDLNIVYSLTGNYGEQLTIDDEDKITVYDLLMTSNEDIYYVPYMPSIVKYYDKDGNLLGSNDKYEVVAQSLSNGIAVAQIVDPDDDDSYLYGAFDTTGKVVIDFKYNSIASFRGYYTIGTRDDEEGNEIVCILGRDGREYTIVSDLTAAMDDIATTSTGSYIYKIGCYMYQTTQDGTTYYGIKNFNPNTSKNTIMEAFMLKGATLYSPSNSTSDVFVFDKITATDSSITYVIYKLK